MSFFKKLRDRMFRSSDKIGEGLEALVAEEGAAASASPTTEKPAVEPAPQAEPEAAKPGLLGRLFGGGAAAEEPRRADLL